MVVATDDSAGADIWLRWKNGETDESVKTGGDGKVEGHIEQQHELQFRDRIIFF